jgi:hypothetical protein
MPIVERNSVPMRAAVRPLLLIAALAFVSSCANPPQADIDAARSALETTAKSADVITYAPDSLRTAQEKMADMENELAAQTKRSPLSRNYDAAKSLAQEAGDAARKAVDDAVTAKDQVEKDAASLAEEVTAAIPQFESKVWAAKRVPRIKMDIITPLALVPNQARVAVDDARKEIDAGAFAVAKAKLMAVKDQLSACEETIVEQTRIARGR